MLKFQMTPEVLHLQSCALNKVPEDGPLLPKYVGVCT